MHKIDKFRFGESLEQFAICFPDCIPTHVRNFVFMLLRNKTFHVHIKDIQAISPSFFGIPAHQLHTETNSEHRLTQILNQFIKSCCL